MSQMLSMSQSLSRFVGGESPDALFAFTPSFTLTLFLTLSPPFPPPLSLCLSFSLP